MNNNQAKSACARCTMCKLSEQRRFPYWGMGEQRAPYLFVFDTPPRDTYKSLLTSWVSRANIRIEDTYITSLVKCPTPNGRAPFYEEMAECWTYLETEISHVGPKAVVLLGKAAIDWLHPYNNVLRVRDVNGLVFEDGLLFMGLYTPSFVMRHPNVLKDEMSDDAIKALAKLKQQVEKDYV